MRKQFFTLVLLLGSVLLSPASHAIPVLGDKLYYSGGSVDVTVESLSVTSGYTSELGLYDSSFNLLLYLMNDEPPGVVVNFNPGDYGFTAGDELIFGIFVRNTAHTYFMGEGSRNPDGIIHAAVNDIGGGDYIVGFEDLYGGGDRDYDDNRFLFSQGVSTSPVPTPTPTIAALLCIGLVGFGVRRNLRA